MDPERGHDERDSSEEGDAPEPDFVRLGLFFYGAMAIVAVLWRVGIYGEPIFFLSSDASAQELRLGRDLAIGVGVGLAIVVLSYVFTRSTRWGDDLGHAMADALGPMSIPNALLLACASGLAEEMFFRGALQPRAGWLLASLLFGAVHFVPRREFAPWTVFAIAVGLLFGGLFIWTGNLVAPVVAHTVVNGINLPLLIRLYGTR